jgi:hypothetical protein
VLHIGSDYELRRDQLWNLLRRLIQPEPNAFSEEVPSGFKNKFGKFFGTDHMLLAGWCSYAEKAKPDDDGIEICFYSGAMAMFDAVLEMFSSGDKEQVLNKEQVLKRIESIGPGKLWEGYRTCLVSDIPSEILDQYKKAFYGGCWFINTTFMAMAKEDAEHYLRGTGALRDEISEFRTYIKRSGLAALAEGRVTF